MSMLLDSNKAKTARRVIEVLEYFNETNRHVTVMDIVRRYNRPQSSTSELLASLVEMGLLYKDSGARSYTLTPRAAILGSLSQPSLVRDGRLTRLIDRLGASTGIGVALVGMIGLNAQIFRWRDGDAPPKTPHEDGLCGGLQQRLHESAAGWLLLATLTADRREGMLRRLNAEAPAAAKFPIAEMRETIQACGRQGHAVGPAGFGAAGEMCAVLLPVEPGERPMALGFVYDRGTRATEGLVDLLKASVQRCVASAVAEPHDYLPVPDAA